MLVLPGIWQVLPVVWLVLPVAVLVLHVIWLVFPVVCLILPVVGAGITCCMDTPAVSVNRSITLLRRVEAATDYFFLIRLSACVGSPSFVALKAISV